MKAVSLSVVVLTLLATGIGGGVAFWGHLGPARRSPPGAVSSWPEEVAANGVVEGARPEIALRPEVSGSIAVLHVRENRDVARGEVLLELSNGPHREQVALAEAEVAVARANLDRLRNGERAEKRQAAAAAERSRHATYTKAKADYERLQKLMPHNSVSKEQHDASYYRMLQAQADWEEAKAEQALAEAPARADEVAAAEGRVRAAEARLRLAQEELARTRLRAPCNGRILQVLAEPGEMAGPTTPRPVLVMADVGRRRVRAFVEELDAARVRIGHEAAVTADGLPSQAFTGKVGEVMPRMGRRTPLTDEPGEYRDLYFREVLLDLDAGDDLPLNLRVRVRIRVGPQTR
jgi:multidrug resistance efflux pump